nr:hypothetical protein [Nordella sp. HKS 07]
MGRIHFVGHILDRARIAGDPSCIVRIGMRIDPRLDPSHAPARVMYAIADILTGEESRRALDDLVAIIRNYRRHEVADRDTLLPIKSIDRTRGIRHEEHVRRRIKIPSGWSGVTQRLLQSLGGGWGVHWRQGFDQSLASSKTGR